MTFQQPEKYAGSYCTMSRRVALKEFHKGTHKENGLFRFYGQKEIAEHRQRNSEYINGKNRKAQKEFEKR